MKWTPIEEREPVGCVKTDGDYRISKEAGDVSSLFEEDDLDDGFRPNADDKTIGRWPRRKKRKAY